MARYHVYMRDLSGPFGKGRLLACEAGEAEARAAVRRQVEAAEAGRLARFRPEGNPDTWETPRIRIWASECAPEQFCEKCVDQRPADDLSYRLVVTGSELGALHDKQSTRYLGSSGRRYQAMGQFEGCVEGYEHAGYKADAGTEVPYDYEAMDFVGLPFWVGKRTRENREQVVTIAVEIAPEALSKVEPL